MNWAYLAGFTDGDGCVSINTRAAPYTYKLVRIRWNQKEADSAVLDAIAEFLRQQGLFISQRCLSVTSAGHRYPQRELLVSRMTDVRVCLENMLPHLIIKREKALEGLLVLDECARYKAETGRAYRVG